ncbi:MAG: LptA/OstA family protein [Pseudomonadota bacterium]
MMRFFAFLFFALLPAIACAQGAFKPAMSMQQGDGPIKIEADSLEVSDKDSTATFSGNVVVRRSDVTLRASKMKVLYNKGAMPGSTPDPSQAANQQIRRIDMSGGVVFVQKDQQATGDAAIYDKGAETVAMRGNVVLTQGQNVARGQKLTIDMRSGAARLEGRPNMILNPSDAKR